MNNETRNGEWYYPNGDMVLGNDSNQDFYRNQTSQQVILNRRNNATSPTGCFCCELVNELINQAERVCITIVAGKYVANNYRTMQSTHLMFFIS